MFIIISMCKKYKIDIQKKLKYVITQKIVSQIL